MYHVPTIFFLTYFGIFDAVGFWAFWCSILMPFLKKI